MRESIELNNINLVNIKAGCVSAWVVVLQFLQGILQLS